MKIADINSGQSFWHMRLERLEFNHSTHHHDAMDNVMEVNEQRSYEQVQTRQNITNSKAITAKAETMKQESKGLESTSTMSNHVQPPPLHFSFRWTTICLYLAFLLLCNVLVPCLLYYLLHTCECAFEIARHVS